MEAIAKLRRLYHLKRVYRSCPIGERKESSAEHTWSCLMLADYFLDMIKIKIDRLKVYELLLYHDIVEIESGDIPALDVKRKDKTKLELEALNKLKTQIPKELHEKLVKLFNEFEQAKTMEARLAKAIDALDAMIQWIDHKPGWKGWTEDTVRRLYEELVKEFPEIKEIYEKVIKYLKDNGYFGQ